MIHGTAGSALLDGNNYTFYDSRGSRWKRPMRNPPPIRPTRSAPRHRVGSTPFRDFVAAIRTGKLNNSPSLRAIKCRDAHLATSPAVGRELHCDPANGRVQTTPGHEALGRDYEPGWEQRFEPGMKKPKPPAITHLLAIMAGSGLPTGALGREQITTLSAGTRWRRSMS